MIIFISHSTDQADDPGRQRLTATESLLKKTSAGVATGHDVLLDFTRLNPGTKWFSELDEWMATCHAAVLMLTPRALTSWWVLKEATILAHRAGRDDKFRLFPVLLDGVTPAQIEASDSRFSPAYLPALQRVKSTVPEGIAAAVLAELAELKSVPETPLEELTTALSVQLTNAKDAPLERICQKITGIPVVWQSGTTRVDRCAREIARAVVVGLRGDYPSNAALIEDLMTAGLSKDTAAQVRNLVSPLWVNGEAAAPLADVASRNLAAKPNAAGQIVTTATAINGDYVPTFTAEQYVRRAYMPKVVTLRTIVGGASEKRLEELIGGIRAVVRNSTTTLTNKTDEQVDVWLATLDRPYFLLLPPPVPDAPLLSALQSKFPRVTFMLQSDSDTLTSGLLPPRVVPLSPPVELDLEQKAVHDFDAINDVIAAK